MMAASVSRGSFKHVHKINGIKLFLSMGKCIRHAG